MFWVMAKLFSICSGLYIIYVGLTIMTFPFSGFMVLIGMACILMAGV